MKLVLDWSLYLCCCNQPWGFVIKAQWYGNHVTDCVLGFKDFSLRGFIVVTQISLCNISGHQINVLLENVQSLVKF